MDHGPKIRECRGRFDVEIEAAKNHRLQVQHGGHLSAVLLVGRCAVERILPPVPRVSRRWFGVTKAIIRARNLQRVLHNDVQPAGGAVGRRARLARHQQTTFGHMLHAEEARGVSDQAAKQRAKPAANGAPTWRSNTRSDCTW
jgi:hypothetical protein